MTIYISPRTDRFVCFCVFIPPYPPPPPPNCPFLPSAVLFSSSSFVRDRCELEQSKCFYSSHAQRSLKSRERGKWGTEKKRLYTSKKKEEEEGGKEKKRDRLKKQRKKAESRWEEKERRGGGGGGEQRERGKLQALVYDRLLPTTATTDQFGKSAVLAKHWQAVTEITSRQAQDRGSLKYR